MSKNGRGDWEVGAVTYYQKEEFTRLSEMVSVMLSSSGKKGLYERECGYEKVLWVDTAHTPQSFQTTAKQILKDAGIDEKKVPSIGKRLFAYSMREVRCKDRMAQLEAWIEAYKPALVVVDCGSSFSVDDLRFIAARYDCHVATMWRK